MNIGVLDYGAGNLKNVCRAVKFLGYNYQLVSSPQDIIKVDKLIIPGVGAFKVAMKQLEDLSIIPAIQELAKSNTPILGICLGMQLLFECSHEFGLTQGLGLLAGSINLIPENDDFGQRKVPHNGWNELIINNIEDKMVSGITPKDAVYFIHSYKAELINSKYLIAHCQYNNHIIPAIVHHNNIIGCQFHPEKSGPIGLKILNNFLNM
jgi:glutamine amidotransferase